MKLSIIRSTKGPSVLRVFFVKETVSFYPVIPVSTKTFSYLVRRSSEGRQCSISQMSLHCLRGTYGVEYGKEFTKHLTRRRLHGMLACGYRFRLRRPLFLYPHQESPRDFLMIARVRKKRVFSILSCAITSGGYAPPGLRLDLDIRLFLAVDPRFE